MVPKRVTSRSLPPPIAGTLWHSTHERPLKTGPSPSSTSSALLNSVLPSAKALLCEPVRPGSGSPNRGGASLVAEAATSDAKVARTSPAVASLKLVPRDEEMTGVLGVDAAGVVHRSEE